MLKCRVCGKGFVGFKISCDCGGLLDYFYERPRVFDVCIDKRFLDIRRYVKLLPLKEAFYPSLTLPLTPIVERTFSNVKVFFKLEYLMPSGSFKDRGTYVTVAKLKEEGIQEVTLDSSGNAALSLALFSKCEGLKAHIFIPSHTSKGKKRLLKFLDAEVHEVEGSRMDVYKKAKSFEGGLYVSHWFNPFFLEGTKLIAYEVYEQVGSIDYVLSPVGSGSLFIGLYKGFKELEKYGKLTMPVMIAVQAKGFESLIERSEEKSSLAEGIAIPEPPRKEEMKEILKESRGKAISVGDSEISEALAELLSFGFLVEPTSAATYAGFKILFNEGYFKGKAKVLIPLTGSGLKSV
ncbi:MAG: pyridoxal-phosphate dependent enzyme [Synergistetes bacterium]|nr:pyridoxal-phosphate dependent enzyme [Synergistota bacterium]